MINISLSKIPSKTGISLVKLISYRPLISTAQIFRPVDFLLFLLLLPKIVTAKHVTILMQRLHMYKVGFNSLECVPGGLLRRDALASISKQGEPVLGSSAFWRYAG